MNRLKKVGAAFFIILINLLLVGIIALNIFLIWKDFPQWIMILAVVLDIAAVLLIAKKVFAGKATKIIAVSITSFFAVLCVLFAYACPYWNSDVFKSDRPIHYYENSDLTKKEALDDLEEVMDYLRKYHISFVDGLTPEVQAKYEEVRGDFESKDTVSRIELIRGVRSILHEIHDAHSTFNSWDQIYLSDGPEMKSKGYSIYSVNGITEERMKELVEPYYSYETPRWISVNMESLFFLDLCEVEAPYEVVWKNEDGDEESCTYNRDDFITSGEYSDLLDKYLPSEDINDDYVYYEIMDDLEAWDLVHWVSDNVTDTSLDEGWAPESEYVVGPNPLCGSTHTYEVYVVALKAPVERVKVAPGISNMKFEENFKALDIDAQGNSGNIIAVGRLTGTFSN